MLKNARLMPELEGGGGGKTGALSFIENVRGEKKLGRFSTDVCEPRTANVEVSNVSFFGVALFLTKERKSSC